jgi:hypothetical protein
MQYCLFTLCHQYEVRGIVLMVVADESGNAILGRDSRVLS